jgi:hypothetical protein
MWKSSVVPFGLAVVFAVFAPLILCQAEDVDGALRRAQALERAGRSGESIQIYQDVLKSAPECSQALVGHRAKLLCLPRICTSLCKLREGAPASTRRPEALNRAGRSYVQEGRPEKVFNLLSREGSGTDSASIHMLRARAEMGNGTLCAATLPTLPASVKEFTCELCKAKNVTEVADNSERP